MKKACGTFQMVTNEKSEDPNSFFFQFYYNHHFLSVCEIKYQENKLVLFTFPGLTGSLCRPRRSRPGSGSAGCGCACCSAAAATRSHCHGNRGPAQRSAGGGERDPEPEQNKKTNTDGWLVCV